MNECDRQSSCLFYKRSGENDRETYCRADDTSNCARYMVERMLGPEQVPEDLHPKQVGRAIALILQGEHGEEHWNDSDS